MPLVWDSQLQAFVETAPPLVYDPVLEAYRETEGLVHDNTLEAWKKVWPSELYLYKDGDECTDITGGWTGIGGSITHDNGDIIYSSTIKTRNAMSTVLPVSLQGHGALYIHYKSIAYSVGTDAGAAAYAGVSSAQGVGTDNNISNFYLFSSAGGAHFPAPGRYDDVTVHVDVPCDASGYIRPVFCNATNATRSVTAAIDKIWLG